MEDKDSRLESLRRVAKRLRELGDDSFAEGLAKRLEEELIRRDAKQNPTSGNEDNQKIAAD